MSSTRERFVDEFVQDDRWLPNPELMGSFAALHITERYWDAISDTIVPYGRCPPGLIDYRSLEDKLNAAVSNSAERPSDSLSPLQRIHHLVKTIARDEDDMSWPEYFAATRILVGFTRVAKGTMPDYYFTPGVVRTECR